jgi:hypothetical protein
MGTTQILIIVPWVVSFGVKDRSSMELTTPIYGPTLRLLSAIPPPPLPPWHAEGQLKFYSQLLETVFSVLNLRT